MSENKHYGRQIFLSLFLTVFLLLAVLFVAARYLLPLYDINQERIYDVLVRLFPILIGLVMIEIGVMTAKRRDEDFADTVDKLPPNAYDKPFYILPQDDPSHLHSENLVHTQSPVNRESFTAPLIVEQQIEEEKLEMEEIRPLGEMATMVDQAPVAETTIEEPVAVVEETITYKTDFKTILALELTNAQEMDYDISLAIINISSGPVMPITNKLMMLSGELSYSFSLEGGLIAMLLPFYNEIEARNFVESLLDSCRKEFSSAEINTGYASRNQRMLEAEQLVHEAQSACDQQTSP
jgi:hypothetical protein